MTGLAVREASPSKHSWQVKAHWTHADNAKDDAHIKSKTVECTGNPVFDEKHELRGCIRDVCACPLGQYGPPGADVRALTVSDPIRKSFPTPSLARGPERSRLSSLPSPRNPRPLLLLLRPPARPAARPPDRHLLRFPVQALAARERMAREAAAPLEGGRHPQGRHACECPRTCTRVHACESACARARERACTCALVHARARARRERLSARARAHGRWT